MREMRSKKMKTDLLIAEANTNLRELYERFFGEMGIRVETAFDGLECWAKLLEFAPDVLVLDMDLLWGGGDGVLARLRNDRDEKLSPTVFITGFDSPISMSRRFGIAIENCLQKPFEPGELLESVCAFVDADAAITFLGYPV